MTQVKIRKNRDLEKEKIIIFFKVKKTEGTFRKLRKKDNTIYIYIYLL